MELLVASFLAGMITVAAPCVLPVLPVVLGGSLAGSSSKRPLIITLSLACSIVVFTLLLRASTALIRVPPQFWSAVSGAIILGFGWTLLFPEAWERISEKLRLGGTSQQWLSKANEKEGVTGMIMIGMALGPVFTTCSPTYALILAIVLPKSPLEGIAYIALYAAGLSAVLLLIAVLGRRATAKLRGIADPHGMFKRGLGAAFVILGIAVILRLDKRLEERILDSGYFGISSWEERLAEAFREQ